MAGQSIPKPSARAARRGGHSETTIRFVHAAAPALPDDIDWPEATQQWWKTWIESPQADLFGATDWSHLLDTALCHADVWAGNLDRLPELRLREAKFGATPADRAALRIQYAAAEEAESGRDVKQERESRAVLKRREAMKVVRLDEHRPSA